MKALIKHLVHEHLTEIAAKSFLDCHVRGVHSLMLLDTPEHRVRLFVATRYHELWRNNSLTLRALAAHPHHCNITLHCVKGEFFNFNYDLAAHGTFDAYRYQSGILHGMGGFVPAPEELPAVFVSSQRVQEGEAIALPASTIHSVAIKQHQPAAWFVYEGKEDSEYSSLSYSDQPLERTVFGDLYGKVTEAHVIELLEFAGLLDTPTTQEGTLPHAL